MTVSQQLLAWWKFLRTAALAAGLLLTFAAVVEIIRVYVVLRDFHPILGVFFVATIVGSTLWLVVRFLSALWSLPRAPTSPQILDRGSLTQKELHAYGRFLQDRMLQLGKNPNLGQAEKDHLADSLSRLGSALTANPTSEAIAQAEASLAAALNPIDRIAEAAIAECVRDVMLGVVLSPSRSEIS